MCRLLNITKRTLQTYRDKRILPYTNVGGKFFYRGKDVAEYLKNRTVKNQ
ncbi:helix-turn-helix domain-containing protein [Gabonibacter chumensis]|nr:helix-turn-helix domain-containing protein [Gabonibacter chumensis]